MGQTPLNDLPICEEERTNDGPALSPQHEHRCTRKRVRRGFHTSGIDRVVDADRSLTLHHGSRSGS